MADLNHHMRRGGANNAPLSSMDYLTDSQLFMLYILEFEDQWPEPRDGLQAIRQEFGTSPLPKHWMSSTMRQVLLHMLRTERPAVVESMTFNPFDLPEGYVTLVTSKGIYGGISPEGHISS